MQVAITGGTGFIGKCLVDAHLLRGDRVRVLTRKKDLSDNRVEYVVGDLRDSDLSRFVGESDVLYHCAGQLTDESTMEALHVDGMMRLLSAAKGKIGRWVQLSSVGVYEKKKEGTVDEEAAIAPTGVYEKTKAEADLRLMDFAQAHNLNYVILRPSNVFGVTMSNQSLAKLVELIKKKLFFYIGKKESSVNYVSVDDVVSALIACATQERAAGQIYNLSQTIKTKEMIDALAKGVGAVSPRFSLPESASRAFAWAFKKVPGFPLTIDRINALTNGVSFSSAKIQEELGFLFKKELTESLRDYSQKR